MTFNLLEQMLGSMYLIDDKKINRCFTIKTLKSIIFSMEVNSDNHIFI